MALLFARFRSRIGSAALVCLFGAPLVHAEAPAVPPDHAQRMKEGLDLFKTQVRPVLVQQCLDCHGGKKTRAGFDLSSRETLMKSGLVGKDAAASQLYGTVAHTREPHMPHNAPRLPETALAAIARWLDLGAPYDRPLIDKAAPIAVPPIGAEQRRFWSFQPLQRVPLPPVQAANWCRTPVDRFILAALEKRGLRPNPEADRRTLIRRVYFDLVGLPPTPAEVDAARNDESPAWFEKVIDRLLASPHYGERWARHWLDVARFAESHGYEQDYDRPNAYPYRDFVIKALNADMPYDQFVRWQLAGDELAPADPLALTATGFLGAGAFPTQLTEAEFESARYDELDDMTATTGVAFLGLSVGCARCHDHKFDPIPTADYYRVAASFTTTIRCEIELELEPGAKPVKVQVASEGFPHMKHHADDRGYPHFYPATHFLQRGDVHQKKGVADPGFLRVLERDGTDEGHWRLPPPTGWERTSFRRAGLASWITDVEHGAGPLAARVIVNRLWQHHFGRGLVATPNDFGAQGERPTHPELLDYLADDLVKNGWQLKRLHKLLLTSAVYRQTSQFDEARATIDRENVYHWRRTPRRLEAEAIRDALLHVAGLLDTRMHGPGTLDPNMHRRSVYFFIKRSKLIPMMMLFDWPEHLVSIGRRSTTTIAPQALAFLNSPQARQYAEGLALRLAGQTLTEAVRQGYLLALGREPEKAELQFAFTFLARQAASYHLDQGVAEQRALVDFCQTLLSMNEFIYVD